MHKNTGQRHLWQWYTNSWNRSQPTTVVQDYCKKCTSPLILLWRTATACAITSMRLPVEVSWVMSKKRKPSRVFDLQAEKQSYCIDIYTSTSRRGPAFLPCCLIPCKTTGHLVLGQQARGSDVCTPAQRTQIRTVGVLGTWEAKKQYSYLSSELKSTKINFFDSLHTQQNEGHHGEENLNIKTAAKQPKQVLIFEELEVMLEMFFR